MSFIAKHIVGSDERLIGVARPHWIYIFIGGFWAVVILYIGAWLHQTADVYGVIGHFDEPIILYGRDFGPRGLWLGGAFMATSAGIFLVFLVEYLSTEVGLTTKRVIRKTGLIAVEVQEIAIEEIESARIRHGWLGTWLGYGAVYLDCRFVGDVALPTIRRPYGFLHALHKAKEPLKTSPIIQNTSVTGEST
jgi:hypothetical protein